MAIQSKFQFGVHVRKVRPLYMMSDKKIYFGEWVVNRKDEIIVVEMSKKIADHEAPFYLAVTDHKHIIHTFGSVENPLNLTIFIQEFAPRGDLADCLMDNQLEINQKMLIQMFIQIADAMSYVASKRIVHGDLGCRNVLVFHLDSTEPKNCLVKITDFGLARWIDRPPAVEDFNIIPIRFCAPEILRIKQHISFSEKSDVYSMAVLMWEALSNSEIPYSTVNDDNQVIQMKLNNAKLPKPSICNYKLWTLMDNCWYKDPEERPTFDEIRQGLVDIKISEVPHDLITASSHRSQAHYDYELGVDVKITRLLNDGTPSVYQAEWISHAERDIVIIERNDELSQHEKLFYTTFQNHKHIVHTFGFVENDRGSTMILQEKAPFGNLRELLENGDFQPTAKVLIEIFSQIVNATLDILDQKLVHGDLRCENILVFEMHASDPRKNVVKLSNFSMVHPNDSSYYDDRRIFIPVRYCAPEIVRSVGRRNYSEYSDVYAMGVLMWQALSNGKIPYSSSKTNGEVRQRRLKGDKLSQPLLCHKQIWLLIENCCFENPETRYEFKLIQATLSALSNASLEPYQYELNVHVKQKRALGGMHGRFYDANWIRKRDPPIVLVVMDTAAEYEASFYMKLSNHPHIIHTFGLVKNDHRSIMLLQERALHGNLQNLLQQEGFHPSPNVLKTIFLQIIDAMIYITDQGIIHCDLRCANVLVFQMDAYEAEQNLVKVTNFSLARTKNQPVTYDESPDTSVRYYAPEILRNADGSGYSELSDVYAMGTLMWVCCSKGEVPYGHRANHADILRQRMNGEKLRQPIECPDKLWAVIEYCWFSELDIRFTFKELQAQLSRLNIPSIPLEQCYNCNKNISQDKIHIHQQTCIPPMPDIDVIDTFTSDNRHGYDNKGYRRNDEDNNHKVSPTKRPRIESPPRIITSKPSDRSRELYSDNPVADVLCRYCNDSYPPGLIDQHERICPKIKPPTRVVLEEPKLQLVYIPCEFCTRQVLSNEIANHQIQCGSERPRLNDPPRPTTTTSFESHVSELVKPKPWYQRLCPCFFRSNN